MKSTQKTTVHCASVSLNDVILQVLDDSQDSQSLLCSGALWLFPYLPSGEQHSVEVEESRTASADKHRHGWLTVTYLKQAHSSVPDWVRVSPGQCQWRASCSAKCTTLVEPNSTISWSKPLHCMWRVITFRQRAEVRRMDIQVKHGYQKWRNLWDHPVLPSHLVNTGLFPHWLQNNAT